MVSVAFFMCRLDDGFVFVFDLISTKHNPVSVQVQYVRRGTKNVQTPIKHYTNSRQQATTSTVL